MGKRGQKVALTKSWDKLSTEWGRAWDRCRRLGTYLGYLYARFQNFHQRIGVFTKRDVSAVLWNLARFVHPHSATLSILHAHVSRAVERSFYPILDCKPVLELSVNALEVVRFSFAHWRSRRRTHAPTADRYPPKMGVTSIFWIWLILIVDVVWRLLIMFKRLNVQFPP